MLSHHELSTIFIVGMNPSLDECPQLSLTGDDGTPEVASLVLLRFFFIEEIEQLMINTIRYRFRKMGRHLDLQDVLFDADVKPLRECIQEFRERSARLQPLQNVNRQDVAKLLQT